MPNTPNTPSRPGREFPSQESLAAFRDFLRRREREPEANFGEFVKLRPGIAEELRRLRDEWERATELLEKLGSAPTLAERLKLTYGSSIDLDISLAGDESKADPLSSTRIVQRLSKGAAGSKTYERRELVARGGMGAILRVWDEELRRTLAMKVVLGRDEQPGDEGTPKVGEHQLVRFLEEAQITGQLHHPGILPVHDLGIDPTGRVYFTMPLVRGETLREIFEHINANAGEGGWNTTRALNVLVKVCEAMAFAHSKGVIHRDLKPANIMVGRFGETYVMDWGLARVLGRKETRVARKSADVGSSLSVVHTDRRDAAQSTPDSALVTMDGDVVGTPAYMSPEQARGDLEALGPRSDVYALGAMLYQLLAGVAPYHKPDAKMSTHTVLARVLDGPPQPIRELRRDVPEELVAICNKAMAREPGERYAGMLELAEDMRAFVEGHVVRAFETGALAEFRKWVARNRVAAAFIATSIVLAIAGLSTVIVQQLRSRAKLEEQFTAVEDERDRAEANEQEATRERDRAEANEREATRLRGEALDMADRARRQSYLGNVRAAEGGLLLYRTREAKERLAACEEELRGWEWNYLARKCDGQERSMHVPEFGSAVLVDGGRLVLVCAGDKIRQWDPEQGEIVSSFSSPKAKNRPAFAVVSGARVYSLHVGGRLVVWDARSGDLVLDSYAHRPFAVFAMAQSADGALFATCGQEQAVLVWDAAQTEVRASFPCDELAQSTAFSPDGRSLAVGYRDGSIRTWAVPRADEPAPEGSRTHSLAMSGHADVITSLAWSPDGALLLSGSSDGSARVWNAATGETVMVLGGHGQGVLAAAFHPDGRRVATGSSDDTIRLWDVASGRQQDVLLGHTGAVSFLAFHSSGKRLFSGGADDTLRVWNLERNPLVVRIRDAHADDIDALAFGPDGRALATGSADGTAKLWNTRTGGPLLTFAGNREGVTSLAFDSTGKKLVTGSIDQSVRVFDTETGHELLVLRGHSKRVLCVATSTAKNLVASGGGDRQIRVWQLDTGAGLSLLSGHQGSLNSVAFSGDGERLVSASSDKTLRLWTLATGQYLVLEGHASDVLATAFSPDGRFVASGSKDATVRVWDAETGTVLHVLEGHDSDVVSVAFAAEGTRLLSASSDRSFRVWDLALGAQLLAVEGDAPLRAIAASGNRVAAAGSVYDDSATHGDVWIWDPLDAP